MGLKVVYFTQGRGLEISQFLNIDLNSEIAGKLFRKAQEYKTRAEKSGGIKGADALAKWKILSLLLTDGRADILQAVVSVKESLGEDFQLDVFENAWAVIEHYLQPGDIELVGGTGLPK